jgi:hypothetical protein
MLKVREPEASESVRRELVGYLYLRIKSQQINIIIVPNVFDDRAESVRRVGVSKRIRTRGFS